MPNHELNQLAADYLRAHCDRHPHEAVWLGFHEYDGRLPDLSRAALAAQAADLRRFLGDLERIDPDDLDDLAWLDWQVLHHQAALEGFVLEDWQRWQQDPLFYLEPLDVSNYIVRNYAPLETRVRALIAHLNGIPSVLAAMRENLTQASRPLVQLGVRVAQGSVEFLATDLPQMLAGLTDRALRAGFDAANRQAIAALEEAAAWLEHDLAPRADADFALGPQRFLRMLRLGEGIDLSLERLRQIAEADLARNKAACLEAAAQVGQGRDVREVIAEGVHRHPAPEALVAETQRIVEEVRRVVIERGVVSVPYDENCIVAPTPPFLRFAFAMMYDTGPFEQVAREAYFYVTPPEPSWPAEKVEEWMTNFNYGVLWTTCVHEAWPGHYLHGLHQRNAPSLLTKAFWFNTTTEGWAHYCEQMMLEVTGRVNDPWARIGQLCDALVRNVRFVAALGLHTAGMTLEQATQRFVEDAFMEPTTAEEEALRGTGDPQYLAYTLGKLMLLKLRADLQEREGQNFNLRAFHDRFLAYGVPPLPVLRALLLGRHERGEIL